MKILSLISIVILAGGDCSGAACNSFYERTMNPYDN